MLFRFPTLLTLMMSVDGLVDRFLRARKDAPRSLHVPEGIETTHEMPPLKANKLEVESFENNRFEGMSHAKILDYTLAVVAFPHQTSCMTKVLLGPVFKVQQLDAAGIDELMAEIKEIEADMPRRRALYEKWKRRFENMDRYSDMPADVRSGTVKAYEGYRRLLFTGERLRATLYAELLNQESYQPTYHHKN